MNVLKLKNFELISTSVWPVLTCSERYLWTAVADLKNARCLAVMLSLILWRTDLEISRPGVLTLMLHAYSSL